MADYITDGPITAEQESSLQAPLALDLTSIFKVMEEDLLNQVESFDGSPDELINRLYQELGDAPLEGNQDIAKSILYKTAIKALRKNNG